MPNVKRVVSKYVVMVLLAIATLIGQQVGFRQPAIAQATNPWSGVIDRIFGRKEPYDPGKKRRGGPRPADLCWITLTDRPTDQPTNQPTNRVWNARPWFVWRGEVRLIGVRRQGEEKVLWQQAAIGSGATESRARAQADMLQPGTARMPYRLQPDQPLPPGNYEWLFFDSTTRSLRLFVPFQVIAGQERATITTALAELDAKLKAEKAGTDAIALQRATFFAQRQLWSDAIQEVYSVKNPSPELQKVAQEIETESCNPK